MIDRFATGKTADAAVYVLSLRVYAYAYVYVCVHVYEGGGAFICIYTRI
jgi:hypothetical protein